MSDHARVFQQVLEVTMGSTVEVKGNLFPACDHHPACAQLTVHAGAVDVTVYPSPIALDALAERLTELAEALRLERGVTA